MLNGPILLAEDNENDAFLMRHAFQKARLSNPLHVVGDGEEVLAYLKGEDQYADRKKFPFPLLVLMDIKMPRLNGLEALSLIRKDPDLKRIVVIVLSSSDLERDINQAFDLRANSYMVKPQNTEGLVEILKTFKDFWLAHNHYPNNPARK